MGKLQLRLDDLQVDSFATSRAADAAAAPTDRCTYTCP